MNASSTSLVTQKVTGSVLSRELVTSKLINCTDTTYHHGNRGSCLFKGFGNARLVLQLRESNILELVEKVDVTANTDCISLQQCRNSCHKDAL